MERAPWDVPKRVHWGGWDDPDGANIGAFQLLSSTFIDSCIGVNIVQPGTTGGGLQQGSYDDSGAVLADFVDSEYLLPPNTMFDATKRHCRGTWMH